MVRQHNAAAAHADGGRLPGYVTNQHGGCGTGDTGNIVVLGEPVTGIA
jgi:hypothetical protein